MKYFIKSDKNINNEQSTCDKTVKPHLEVFSKEREEFRIMNLYKEALEFQMRSQFNEVICSLEEILTSTIMKENVIFFTNI